MKALTPLAIPCERPPRFDLAAFWKESTAQLERQRQKYETILLLEPRAARSISEWCSVSPVKGRPAPPEGWLKLSVKFERQEQAEFVIRGLGTRAQVIAPADLRERILADARTVVARQLPTRKQIVQLLDSI